MKKLLGILVLGLLWCNVVNAALFYGKETLPVVSKPEGANCILKNNKGSWEVKTPATVELKLSKKDLEIVCKKDGYKTKIITVPLKDKNDLADGAYNNVYIIDSEIDADDFILDSIVTATSTHPVLLALNTIDLIVDYWEKVVKKTASVVKNTASVVKNTATKTGKFLKKSFKAESTYANALINSQRLDQKISESSIQKAKKGSYYSMIYIELEKN